MLITMETVTLMEKAENLAKLIFQSELGQEHRQALQCLQQDKQAQEIIYRFTKIKEQYEDVQRFGKHHPDFQKMRKQMREIKRELDLNDIVYRYKKAENAIQEMLDEISTLIGESVSPSIKVPTGNPFFDKGGCSGTGSCGSSCGCK